VDWVGGTVTVIGYAMLGIAYIWFGVVAIGWAIEMLNDVRDGERRGLLALAVLAVLFFPVSLVLLPVLWLSREAPPPSENGTSFPI
jgi:ABC-type Co2+ transport system permease subunit